MPMFPQRLDSPLAYDIAKAMVDGFNRHYRLFRTESAPRQAPLRDGRLARPAAGAARAHRVLRPAGEGSDDPAREGIQGRRAADGRVAAGQAALHRPAGGPPPARAGRDLLQLGHHQDTAPHALPQRLHLRAPGRFHRIHRERRARRAAHLPLVLPHARKPGRDDRAHHRQLPAAAPVRGPGARRRLRAAGDERAAGPGQAAGQLPDPGAVVAVLPQQGRVRGGQDHQRLQRDAVRAADPAQQARQARHRRLPVRRGRAAGPVLVRARLLHGGHGDPVGVRAVPALADAAQAAQRNLQRAGPGQAGQDAVLPRLPLPPASIRATSSASPPASRAW